MITGGGYTPAVRPLVVAFLHLHCALMLLACELLQVACMSSVAEGTTCVVHPDDWIVDREGDSCVSEGALFGYTCACDEGSTTSGKYVLSLQIEKNERVAELAKSQYACFQENMCHRGTVCAQMLCATADHELACRNVEWSIEAAEGQFHECRLDDFEGACCVRRGQRESESTHHAANVVDTHHRRCLWRLVATQSKTSVTISTSARTGLLVPSIAKACTRPSPSSWSSSSSSSSSSWYRFDKATTTTTTLSLVL